MPYSFIFVASFNLSILATRVLFVFFIRLFFLRAVFNANYVKISKTSKEKSTCDIDFCTTRSSNARGNSCEWNKNDSSQTRDRTSFFVR